MNISNKSVSLASNAKVGVLEEVDKVGHESKENYNRLNHQRVLICADSHGSNIQNLLAQCVPSAVCCKVNVVPNGTLKHVMANLKYKIKRLNNQDLIVIMLGGTNDVVRKGTHLKTIRL